jgi:hypothetical protein
MVPDMTWRQCASIVPLSNTVCLKSAHSSIQLLCNQKYACDKSSVPVECQKPSLLYTSDAWQLLVAVTYLDGGIIMLSGKPS